MNEQFIRQALVLGENKCDMLKMKKVAVFGIGGVGGHAVDALARAGVGTLWLIDGDKVALSNLNRQLLALRSTVGQNKTDVAKARVLDINPDCVVLTETKFFTPENMTEFDFSDTDYILDCIDTVKCKTELIVKATKENVPIISAMGAGNKLDPTAFKVADIYKTDVCPLAKVMRRELKLRGVKKLKTVYSSETPQNIGKERTPGSVSFVPPVAGLIMAGEVIKDLIKD
jgi:tRNA A37 threonylcarbamoyladenosine dehydratase